MDIEIPPPRPKRRPSATHPRLDGSSGDFLGGDTGLASLPDYAAAVRNAAGAPSIPDITIAAVTAAASAAAAAAAAAVVAAAGREIEAQLQMNPPEVFPFCGLTPAMLRNMSNPAAIQANIQASIAAASGPPAPPVPSGMAAAPVRNVGVERTGTSEPGYQRHPPKVHGEDGEDSACSRENEERRGRSGGGGGMHDAEGGIAPPALGPGLQATNSGGSTLARLLAPSSWQAPPPMSTAFMGPSSAWAPQFSDPISIAAQLWATQPSSFQEAMRGVQNGDKNGDKNGTSLPPKPAAGKSHPGSSGKGSPAKHAPLAATGAAGVHGRKAPERGSKSTLQNAGGGGGGGGGSGDNGSSGQENASQQADQPTKAGKVPGGGGSGSIPVVKPKAAEAVVRGEGEGSGSNPTGNGSSLNGSVHPNSNGNGNGAGKEGSGNGKGNGNGNGTTSVPQVPLPLGGAGAAPSGAAPSAAAGGAAVAPRRKGSGHSNSPTAGNGSGGDGSGNNVLPTATGNGSSGRGSNQNGNGSGANGSGANGSGGNGRSNHAPATTATPTVDASPTIANQGAQQAQHAHGSRPHVHGHRHSHRPQAGGTTKHHHHHKHHDNAGGARLPVRYSANVNANGNGSAVGGGGGGGGQALGSTAHFGNGKANYGDAKPVTGSAIGNNNHGGIRSSAAPVPRLPPRGPGGSGDKISGGSGDKSSGGAGEKGSGGGNHQNRSGSGGSGDGPDGDGSGGHGSGGNHSAADAGMGQSRRMAMPPPPTGTTLRNTNGSGEASKRRNSSMPPPTRVAAATPEPGGCRDDDGEGRPSQAKRAKLEENGGLGSAEGQQTDVEMHHQGVYPINGVSTLDPTSTAAALQTAMQALQSAGMHHLVMQPNAFSGPNFPFSGPSWASAMGADAYATFQQMAVSMGAIATSSGWGRFSSEPPGGQEVKQEPMNTTERPRETSAGKIVNIYIYILFFV